MRESGATLAVAEGPNAGDVCFEPAVHFDKTVLVGFNAGYIETEIIRIRTASGADQEMRAGDAR